VVLGLLWCNTSFTESTLPPCQGEDHMQWTNCVGTYLKKDVKPTGWTRDYTGEFGSILGKREGQGSSKVYRDGSLYATYVGEFKDDKLNGQVNIMYANGKSYVGEFKDNKLNGQGTMTIVDGSTYVGGWKDSKRHGQGTMTWAGTDGYKYVGEFKDNKRHGQGTETWANGDKYVGGWKDSKRHGQGFLTLHDEKYTGQFKNNKFDGLGTYFYDDKNIYRGEWKNDKRNGKGTIIYSNKDALSGLFKDGKFISLYKRSYSDENKRKDFDFIENIHKKKNVINLSCYEIDTNTLFKILIDDELKKAVEIYPSQKVYILHDVISYSSGEGNNNDFFGLELNSVKIPSGFYTKQEILRNNFFAQRKRDISLADSADQYIKEYINQELRNWIINRYTGISKTGPSNRPLNNEVMVMDEFNNLTTELEYYNTYYRGNKNFRCTDKSF